MYLYYSPIVHVTLNYFKLLCEFWCGWWLWECGFNIISKLYATPIDYHHLSAIQPDFPIPYLFDRQCISDILCTTQTQFAKFYLCFMVVDWLETTLQCCFVYLLIGINRKMLYTHLELKLFFKLFIVDLSFLDKKKPTLEYILNM